MTFGPRLEAIGKMALKNKILADIGTDHAYLPVLLVKNGIIKKAIAGDIAKGPCEAARKAILFYNMEEKIEVRLGNGLAVLKPGEAKQAAICGMGGSTIINILEESPEVVEELEYLILQPMNGADILRKYLLSHNWKLVKEDLVVDNDKLYEVLALKKGISKIYPDIFYEVGPLLIEEQHPKLQEQIDKLIEKYDNVLRVMDKSSAAKESDRYKDFLRQKRSLEELKNENNG